MIYIEMLCLYRNHHFIINLSYNEKTKKQKNKKYKIYTKYTLRYMMHVNSIYYSLFIICVLFTCDIIHTLPINFAIDFRHS